MSIRKAGDRQSPLFNVSANGDAISPINELPPEPFAGKTSPEDIAMAQVTFLLSNIGNLAIQDRAGLANLEQRDRFRNNFSWVPYWKQEATIANRGLAKHFDVLGASVTNSLSAIEGAYQHAQTYYGQSMKTLDILQNVADLQEDGEVQVYTDNIRADDDALFVLARYVSNVEALNEFNWPVRKRSQKNTAQLFPSAVTDKRLQGIKMKIGQLDDADLSKLWHVAYDSNLQRSSFWKEQLGSVQDHPRIVELEHEKRPERRSA